MKKILVSLACIALLLQLGCDASSSSRVRFINRSNHTVTVRPDGDLFWSAFTLQPGEKKTIKAEKVFFTYEPESLVKYEQEDDGDVIFSNQNVDRADGG